MANYKNLLVWKKAHELALTVYKLTEKFPKKEQFGIVFQLRKAALSVPTNIVEGYNRKSKKEIAYFIEIALGSLAETQYLIEFSYDMGYIKEEELKELQPIIEETGKLLWSFQRSKLPSSISDNR